MRPALVAIAIVALAAAAAANPEPARNRSSEHPDQAQGITWYGNWCGGGHGGYQDCCNGGPCPACNWHDAGVTDDCLAQCPPVDDMDAACSRHDYCCFQNPLPSGLSCSPEGNRCMCDCNLIAGVQAASCGSLSCSAYSEELIETFTHVLSCYYYGSGPSDDAQACSQVQCPEGWCTSCSMSPSCNGDISGQYSVTQFC